MPGLRVEPAAQVAIVDLGLVAGLGRRAGHRTRSRVVSSRELRPAVAAEAREADRQAVLVTQSLMDGGHRVGLEHRGDQLAVGRDARIGQAARPGVDQLREPVADQLRPVRRSKGWPAGHDAGRLGRGHVLAHRLDVQPQALRDDQLGPAGVPVLEHLHDIDHVERSPCQACLPLPGPEAEPLLLQGAPPEQPPPLVPTTH